MKINKVGYSLVFSDANEDRVFPMYNLIFIGSDNSDIINVRLKASRRNIYKFNYKDIEGVSFSSSDEAIKYLTDLSNENNDD